MVGHTEHTDYGGQQPHYGQPNSGHITPLTPAAHSNECQQIRLHIVVPTDALPALEAIVAVLEAPITRGALLRLV
jgi:hypothetical protein